MLHRPATQNGTHSKRLSDATATEDLSHLSTPRSDSLICRNPLVPSTAYFLSRILANPIQRAALLKRLNLDSLPGRNIDDWVDSMLLLNPSEKRGPSPLNPEYWLSKLTPSELPFDAAERHLNRHQSSEALSITKLARHMGEMGTECALTICIPVSSEESADTVRKTLRLLTHQTCEKTRFEVLLLFNHPDETTDSDEGGSPQFYPQCEPLLAEVDVAREGGLRVYSCAASASEELLTIGHIRATLHTIAIERYRQRGPGYRDHLLMRADIDMDFIEPTLVEALLAESEKSPRTVNFFGRLRAAPEALVEDPLLLFGYQLYDQLAGVRRECGKNPCGGPNATTWLTTYVQSGGYEPWLRCGEDVSLDGLLIELAKEHDGYTPFVMLDDHSTIYTNTRRAEVAALAGFSPAQQWHRDVAIFSARNPEVRTSSKFTHGSFDEVLGDPLLRMQVEKWIHQSVAIFFTKEGLQDQRVMARMADIIASRWGVNLSLTIDPTPNNQGRPEYRIVVEDLGTFAATITEERKALIATQERIKEALPLSASHERPRAPGLKYDYTNDAPA